jgi:hypothetical protein
MVPSEALAQEGGLPDRVPSYGWQAIFSEFELGFLHEFAKNEPHVLRVCSSKR